MEATSGKKRVSESEKAVIEIRFRTDESIPSRIELVIDEQIQEKVKHIGDIPAKWFSKGKDRPYVFFIVKCPRDHFRFEDGILEVWE